MTQRNFWKWSLDNNENMALYLSNFAIEKEGLQVPRFQEIIPCFRKQFNSSSFICYFFHHKASISVSLNQFPVQTDYPTQRSVQVKLTLCFLTCQEYLNSTLLLIFPMHSDALMQLRRSCHNLNIGLGIVPFWLLN